MKSSGCLYGLSGQGVHFLYQSQLLPAFLTVCNAVFEIRDQSGPGKHKGFAIMYVWVAFPYFGLKIAVGDLLRPWLCFIQLIIIIFFQGEWRKRRLDDQKFSLLFASALCRIFTILVTFLKILNHLHHFEYSFYVDVK